MIGRAAYHAPYILAAADGDIFGLECAPPSRAAVVAAYRPYVARMLAAGVPLHRMTRHLLGLYHGEPGGRLWRRLLSEGAAVPGAGIDAVDAALDAVEAARERAATRPAREYATV
jgi:tRNA-dihydrouridine synthase A